MGRAWCAAAGCSYCVELLRYWHEKTIANLSEEVPYRG